MNSNRSGRFRAAQSRNCEDAWAEPARRVARPSLQLAALACCRASPHFGGMLHEGGRSRESRSASARACDNHRIEFKVQQILFNFIARSFNLMRNTCALARLRGRREMGWDARALVAAGTAPCGRVGELTAVSRCGRPSGSRESRSASARACDNHRIEFKVQ